jgi:hypothetical protein
LFVQLLLSGRRPAAASFPFSFDSLCGEEALVAFRTGFSGLAWVSAFGTGLG